MDLTNAKPLRDWWRLAPLVLANLLPLAAVFWYGWSLSDLILLYWLESGVIGFFTVARMLVARSEGLPQAVARLGKRFGVPFFVMHYGIFWLVHGMFVYAFFGGADDAMMSRPGSFFFGAFINTFTRADVFAWPLLGLLVSHALSFVTEYLLTGAYRSATINQLMAQPYGRVVVLHLTILGGGFLAMALGPSTAVLLVFVAVKVGVDLWTQRREGEVVSLTPAAPESVGGGESGS